MDTREAESRVYPVLLNDQIGAVYSLSVEFRKAVRDELTRLGEPGFQIVEKLPRHHRALFAALKRVPLESAGEGVCRLVVESVPRGWGYRLRSRDGAEELDPVYPCVQLVRAILSADESSADDPRGWNEPDVDLRRAYERWERDSTPPGTVDWIRVRNEA